MVMQQQEDLETRMLVSMGHRMSDRVLGAE